MAFFTYILYSPKFDKFYVGQTNDVVDRLRRHIVGSETFTSKYTDWTLLWFVKKESRADAMALEKKLKNLTKRRILAFIEKYS